MNAQEVAIKLLNAWKADPPPLLSPNELHARYFLGDVCAFLGVAATVHPAYGFAQMPPGDYGATIQL